MSVAASSGIEENSVEQDAKYGTPWSDEELDLIVADYFAMLTSELRRERYVKSRHSLLLMDRIRRSHRSVEFKHQNISAVLRELGLPWIPGYKPKENYQNSIFGALDRFLSSNPTALETLPIPNGTDIDASDVFVTPPEPRKIQRLEPEGLQKLIRKFDPAMRDLRNRRLGRAGEAFVLDVERKWLASIDRLDLARKVKWVAAEDGDGAGFDILSYSGTGSQRLIEVKTTNGAGRTPFFITRNEFDTAAENPTHWEIYRVHFFSSAPRIFTVKPPLENYLQLRPENWRASILSQ